MENIEIKLRLSLIKPIHAAWVVDIYNHMPSERGIEIIESGWRASGILDALRKGSSALPSIDPFVDIGPMLPAPMSDDDAPNVGAVGEYIDGKLSEDDSDDDNDEDEYNECNKKRCI